MLYRPSGTAGAGKSDPDSDPLVLLVQNQAGYLNLLKLVRIAYFGADGINAPIAPQISLDDLAAQAQGRPLRALLSPGARTHVPLNALLSGDADAESKVIGIQGKFKILKFSRKKANVVVSRRAFLEEERDSLRKGLLDHIQEGDVVEARVKNITDYGVFMDLGGLDGLMHVTDMSWGTGPEHVTFGRVLFLGTMLAGTFAGADGAAAPVPFGSVPQGVPMRSRLSERPSNHVKLDHKRARPRSWPAEMDACRPNSRQARRSQTASCRVWTRHQGGGG